MSEATTSATSEKRAVFLIHATISIFFVKKDGIFPLECRK